MTDKKPCSAKVSDGWNTYQCSKPAVVEREGKAYCRIHDPEYIKEKQAKRNARWEAKHKADQEHWAWERARNRLVAGLTTEELNQLTPDILRGVIHKGVKVL